MISAMGTSAGQQGPSTNRDCEAGSCRREGGVACLRLPVDIGGRGKGKAGANSVNLLRGKIATIS